MSNIELSDLLENNESPLTPQFQTKLSAKKEFNELASTVAEKLASGRGKYFAHQKFYHRFLRIYDNLLILDEAGTGKSCDVLGFTEWVLRERSKPINKRDAKLAKYNKFIVLVRGSTQKQEIKDQLICKCSDGHYEEELNQKHPNGFEDESRQKSAITTLMKNTGYKLTTYTKFMKEIESKYPESDPSSQQRLIEDYSNVIFWVDEAQFLMVEPESSESRKQNEKTRVYQALWRVFHQVPNCKHILSSATPMINSTRDLTSLMNLILPANGKIPEGYRYTSAPANDLRVFFPNLPPTIDIRTAPKGQIDPYFQGQIPANYQYDNKSEEQLAADLEPYFRGRIGFVRAADTGAIFEPLVNINIPNVPNDPRMQLYLSPMSDFQTAAYLRAQGMEKDGNKLYTNVRQASNFVFPDGYWGNGITDSERQARKRVGKKEQTIDLSNIKRIEDIKEIDPELIDQLQEELDEEENEIEASDKRAYRRYVNPSTSTANKFAATDEFKKYLADPVNIWKSSAKYWNVIQFCKTYPGNCFVYDEFVRGSGVEVLALCFDAMGFERYDEKTSMFVSSGADKTKEYCSTGASSTRKIRDSIRPYSETGRYRYAILSKDVSDAENDSIKEAMNSYENRHSEYIKVLITSRIGREGINVANVVQYHLIGPEWNQSNMYQAEMRTLRATSHEYLLAEERERLIKEGRDPDTAKIKIWRFYHAALPQVGSQLDWDAIDVKMYQVSSDKDHQIKKIMRIAKRCSIGCQVHYNRNVRPGDVDYSAACDYDKCRYDCIDPPFDSIDYSNYNLLYADDYIDQVTTDIRNIFRQLSSINFDDLRNMLIEYNPELYQNFSRKNFEFYMVVALERLSAEKMIIRDRYGFPTYLRENNGIFYLDRDYPTGEPQADLRYYTEELIALDTNELSNLVQDQTKDVHNELLTQIEGFNTQDPEYKSKVYQLIEASEPNVLINLLETVVVLYYIQDGARRTTAVSTIFERLYNYVHFLYYPEVEIAKEWAKVNDIQPKKGRKPSDNPKRKIANLKTEELVDFQVPTSGPPIIAHHMYSLMENKGSGRYDIYSNVFGAKGKIRLMDFTKEKMESPDPWRDAQVPVESTVYRKYVKIMIDARKDQLVALARSQYEYPIYGIKYSGAHAINTWNIADMSTEAEIASIDNRNKNKGRACNSWIWKHLITVAWKTRLPRPVVDEIEENSRTLQSGSTAARNNVYNTLVNNVSRSQDLRPEEVATWTIDKLLYYAAWNAIKSGGTYSSSDAVRKYLCESLYSHLQSLGCIYYA